jgi:energy-coupling factor transport system substrate-specific component
MDHKPAVPQTIGERQAIATPHRSAGIAASVVLGAAVWAIGLPSSVTLFGTPLSDLTVPAALVVALAGIALVGALTARAPWRVAEMVVAAVLAVAFGFVYWGVAAAWTWLTTPLAFYPPGSAALAGIWVMAGVLGGLIVRKPGAALFTELVAAVIEALLGNQWGFATVWYGLVEGLGAEFVLALLLYRSFGLGTAVAAGAGAGAAVGLLDAFVYYPDFGAGYKTAYVLLAIGSGAVIAGAGSWALARGLARAGALTGLAAGRQLERV